MKFKDKPKILDEIEKEKKAQAIIDAVDNHPLRSNLEGEKEKPWRLLNDPSIKNVTVFSFRIPKEEMMQLKYLSAYKMISMNALCLTAIRRYLKQELKDIERG